MRFTRRTVYLWSAWWHISVATASRNFCPCQKGEKFIWSIFPLSSNAVPFTPTQVEAIRSGMQPGLTMVCIRWLIPVEGYWVPPRLPSYYSAEFHFSQKSRYTIIVKTRFPLLWRISSNSFLSLLATSCCHVALFTPANCKEGARDARP